MRIRVLTFLACASALLVLPSMAQAAPMTVLKVRSCETGDTAKERQATYYARMRAVPGAVRMQMRFTLIDRAGDETRTIKSPHLTQWRRSRLSVRSFGYAQTVTGLEPGGAYAVIVEYKWIGVTGKAIKSARRTSSDCRQDGERPNLDIVRVSTRPKATPGAEAYQIEIENTGSVAAREFDVALYVDSAAADTTHVHEVLPGETVAVTVAGPRCTGRIRAVVDSADEVSETTEDDNVFRRRCSGLR
jgi:archaellum component FlaF (FlaF/FlaG flagellin family)